MQSLSVTAPSSRGDGLYVLGAQEGAKSRGEDVQTPTLLDIMQEKLDRPGHDPAKAQELMASTTHQLQEKLSRLRGISYRLSDDGVKVSTQCQHIEAELKRRQEEEKSKKWRQQVGNTEVFFVLPHLEYSPMVAKLHLPPG